MTKDEAVAKIKAILAKDPQFKDTVIKVKFTDKKDKKMKKYARVIYHKAEWIFIEKLGNKYLLKSLNKNVNDILADAKKVRKLTTGRETPRSKRR